MPKKNEDVANGQLLEIINASGSENTPAGGTEEKPSGVAIEEQMVNGSADLQSNSGAEVLNGFDAGGSGEEVISTSQVNEENFEVEDPGSFTNFYEDTDADDLAILKAAGEALNVGSDAVSKWYAAGKVTIPDEVNQAYYKAAEGYFNLINKLLTQ